MKAHIITLGCQMNEYDTHLVASQLVAGGHELVEHVDAADLVLINTCAVRGKPVEKVKGLLGNLRRVKAQRPLLVGVMGCLAQLEEGQEVARKFDVDILLGPGALTDINGALAANERYWNLNFLDELREVTPPPPSGSLSAFLTIQRGCDHHCTYCIVPTTRGPQVSREPDVILRELDALLAAGVQEVTLLGQNVNAYGLDQRKLGRDSFPGFANLLRAAGERGAPSLKFTTSHPMDFSDEIIAAIAETPGVAPYIHLPVQSGSSRLLKRMGREYTREWYLERIERIRAVMPQVFLSTDIIVGFPGETEADFSETLSLYEAVGYDAAYMFLYSARPGTPSYAHFDDMPHGKKVERLQRLIEVQKRWSLERNTALVGSTILSMLRGPAIEPSFWEGHTVGNHPILVPDAPGLKAGLTRVQVEHATPHTLYGRALNALEEHPMNLNRTEAVA